MALSLSHGNGTERVLPTSQAFVELVNSDAQSTLGVCAMSGGDNGKIAAQDEKRMAASRIVGTRLPNFISLPPWLPVSWTCSWHSKQSMVVIGLFLRDTNLASASPCRK
jgi:hypothetical protein